MFLVVMAYSTVPTPPWSLYQERDGFSTLAITFAFAAYAAGVVISLFLAGHLGAGGILTGAGGGPLFKAALAVAASLADASHRGDVLAGIFLIGYIGLTLPVVGISVATLAVSLTTALIGFTVVTVAIALCTAIPLLTRMPGGSRMGTASLN
ncbi:hypothetical protein [Micromonospora pisi]|nr:hypothetical protein [Micromonospora pisi]